ncbi:MAG: hypothetical protein EOM90_11615 [Alphaproteobacteria bacterium]|nr:hypothetical protein [Alphaproteobacteria bacterium]
MKKKIAYLFILILAISCSREKTNFDQLQERNGLLYMVNDNNPFTGNVMSYANGKVSLEGNVTKGLKEGLWIYYYPNGQKKMEGTYKDGLKDGQWNYWSENGVQNNMEMYRLGNRLGVDNETTAQENESTEVKTDSIKQAPPPAAAQPKKPAPVNYDWLTKGPVKYYHGKPYTGPFIRYYKEGSRGKYIYGYFTYGKPSGKWTFYNRDGTVKEYKYY